MMIGLVALFLGCSIAMAADAKYTHEDGKFKVAFPKGKKVEKTTQDVPGDLKNYMFMVTDGEKVYIVTYMDLGDKGVKAVGAKKLLELTEGGVVTGSKGKLVKSSEIKFGNDKLPGRDVLIDLNGNLMHYGIVIDGQRMYMFGVAGSEEFATSKDGEAFFKSFEITK
jgi:hypothetical protein